MSTHLHDSTPVAGIEAARQLGEELTAAVAQLAPHERLVIDKLLALHLQVVGVIESISKAIGALDELDTAQDAQIQQLAKLLLTVAAHVGLDDDDTHSRQV